MYVGFEIEVESCEEGSYDNVLDLVEKACPITSWSREQGIGRYHRHECMSQQGLWRVESDASLRCGAEFIMPPVDKDTAFSLLEKFFELIDGSNCHTSSRCGLHLNISNDNLTVDNVNVGHFITNINYRLLAKLWPDRAKDYNTYCVGLKHILLSMLNNRMVNFGSDKQQQEVFQKEILKGHNNMINMRLSIGGGVKERFEIRAMGGRDYHKKLKEIKITTNMFEELLKESCEICENTHTNKKIISYINRLHNRHDLQKFVWVPTQHGKNMHSEYTTLVRNLHSIKNIHKHGAWDFLEKINRVYTSAYPTATILSHKSFDAYCAIMLQTVCSGVSLNNEQWNYQNDTWKKKYSVQSNGRNDEIIELTNEAIYHIVKYMSNNPTVYQPSLCTKIIRRYMTGRLKIGNNRTTLTIPENERPNRAGPGNNRLVLTIPKSEKQRDIVWLAKHMHMFNNNTRQEYINRLSKHMLVFINKHKEKYGKGIFRMSQRKIKELSN